MLNEEELQKIDISNLRFYARMATEFKWGTDVLHFGVIVSTLEAIADRLAVSAPPQPNVQDFVRIIDRNEEPTYVQVKVGDDWYTISKDINFDTALRVRKAVQKFAVQFFAAAPAQPDNRAYTILADALQLNPEYYGLIEMAQVAANRLTGKYDTSAQEPPDKAMLEAVAEDGLLVTWDKDFKFNFSQVVRLMAEFVIEHPWAVAAQEQPVENSPVCPNCELPTKPMYGDEPPSEWDHHCPEPSPQKGKP